ncbi:DNA translocase FtsK [Thermithiobacillus plumbiphilus]|uniref:DNA translocase FtsK 4TM domain-containing protein n=1 Tax=Thermithiobacillus plumbiphilus TaxID=1729899 RepID=A0ABU9D459_9PROT
MKKSVVASNSRPASGAAARSSGRKGFAREPLVFLLAALSVYMSLALLSYHHDDPSWSHSGPGTVQNLGGVVGAHFADIGMQLFGLFAYMLPLGVALGAIMFYREGTNAGYEAHFARRMLGFVFIASAGGALLHYFWPVDWWMLPATGAGGLWGSLLGDVSARYLHQIGASVFFLALLIAGISLALNRSLPQLLEHARQTLAARPRVPRDTSPSPLARFKAVPPLGRLRGLFSGLKLPSREKAEEPFVKTAAAPRAPRPEPAMLASAPFEEHLEAEIIPAAVAAPPTVRPAPPPRSHAAPRQETFSELGLPSLAMLDEAEGPGEMESDAVLAQRSRFLEEKLADFGVSVRVVAVHPGPVITRFEIEPGPGVKVSQVSNLSKDLARSLSAISVRVVETIPGKSVMGIEIPNAKRSIVRLREVFDSAAFDRSESMVTLALGKDINGIPVAADLARMPHLLVAGTTGSGKSVAVNAMILSILYKARADQVRMIMVDPKMLELSVYEGIPHLLAPVVTDMKEAANALRWSVAEMERRYKLMASVGVRNLAGFNRKVNEAIAAGEPLYDSTTAIGVESAPPLEPLPVIVVLIDELADLMMVVGKQVEDLITRLAQKARAAGIHLIMATQRPSVDVITGLIKANVPTRVAFQVSSKIDSRTILDQGGAEQLLGHGDMLYLPPGTGHPVRVHGAFVSDEEIHRVVGFLRSQGQPEYIESILKSSDDEGSSEDGDEGGEQDPLYDSAVAIVTQSGKASTSMVQRKLRVGYNRAARMVEEMERAGIVGPLQSNGSREVYAPPPPID